MMLVTHHIFIITEVFLHSLHNLLTQSTRARDLFLTHWKILILIKRIRRSGRKLLSKYYKEIKPVQIIIIHFFNLAENDRTYQSPIGEFLRVNFQVFQVKRTGWEAERTRLNFLTEFTWLPSSEHLRIDKVASFTFWLNFDSDCVTYLSLWRKTQGGCFGAYRLKMHKLCYFFVSWIVYLISVTSRGLLYLWCFHSDLFCDHRTHKWCKHCRPALSHAHYVLVHLCILYDQILFITYTTMHSMTHRSSSEMLFLSVCVIKTEYKIVIIKIEIKWLVYIIFI